MESQVKTPAKTSAKQNSWMPLINKVDKYVNYPASFILIPSSLTPSSVFP